MTRRPRRDPGLHDTLGEAVLGAGAERSPGSEDTVAASDSNRSAIIEFTGEPVIGIADLITLLSQWGDCPAQPTEECEADLAGDDVVGILDLVLLLSNWDE